MFAAILLMAGSGERMGGTLKQYRLLKDKKVYLHTLDTFLNFPEFQQIILVVADGFVNIVEEETAQFSHVKVVKGGKSRRHSSYQGLLACDQTISYVVIHDAVRPFVSDAIIQANIDAVQTHAAVDTCIPTADTIVQHGNGYVEAIPNRDCLLRGQTPQSFSYNLIRRAHEEVEEISGALCDCALALKLGHQSFIVPGEERNMKITSEEDWALVEMLCDHLAFEKILIL